VQEENNEYDVFSRELLDFGKEVMDKSFEIEKKSSIIPKDRKLTKK
jgi:hypothetical protein